MFETHSPHPDALRAAQYVTNQATRIVVKAAGDLAAQAIARRHPEELALTAQELHDAQVGWCADQAERFQAYMRERRDPGFTASGSWPRR